MFTDNSYRSVLKYFQDKLGDYYSTKEIKTFCEWTAQTKFGTQKTDLILGDIRYSETELLVFRAVMKELRSGKPIQYILNETEFYGHTFYVDENVLIPRPETEELVQLILDRNVKGKLLDIGTGSGIIPISLGLSDLNLELEGWDVSQAALKVAQRNAMDLGVEVEWHQQDVFEDIDKQRGKYDCIVSNPPYVLESDSKEMENHVLQHEPHLALFVPDDQPLRFYVRIAEIARNLLKESGELYLEIHERFGEEIKSMLEEKNYREIKIHKDLQGKDRMVSAQKNSPK